MWCNILKTMFSKHGILAWVFTDQGRQFASAECHECYRFEILHLMPRYSQSNGFIECMVKITKEIMSRANQGGEDAHLAVLAYRVTPRGSGKLSPAEAMTKHKLRALLPIKQHLFTQLNASKGLPGPNQLRSHVYQEQKIHLTGSWACSSRIIYTNATSGIATEQATATTKQHKAKAPPQASGHIATPKVTSLCP